MSLTIMPQLGISREGRSIEFKANEPVLWSVERNSGRATFTQLSSTAQTLSLQAGSTGGGEYTVIGRLTTPACSDAASAGALCSASSSWRILSTVQSVLVDAMLVFGISAFLFNAYRFWHFSQEAQQNGRRRLVVTNM